MIDSARDLIVGGTPGCRVWECGQCGATGPMRPPFRVVYWRRAVYSGVEASASSVVCGEACLRKLLRKVAKMRRYEINALSEGEEAALRTFAEARSRCVRATHAPAPLVRKGVLEHMGGREYAWTNDGIAVARSVLGRPAAWAPAHRVFEFRLPGGAK